MLSNDLAPVDNDGNAFDVGVDVNVDADVDGTGNGIIDKPKSVEFSNSLHMANPGKKTKLNGTSRISVASVPLYMPRTPSSRTISDAVFRLIPPVLAVNDDDEGDVDGVAAADASWIFCNCIRTLTHSIGAVATT